MINDACRKSTHKILFFLVLFFLPCLHGALYPYGIENGDKQIDWPKWELGSEQITLDTSLPLLGDGTLSSVWVNTLGSITYRQLMDSRLENIVNNIVMAPFFSLSSEGSSGAVYYRQTTTNNVLLTLIADDVSSALILPPSNDDIETLDFRPTFALIVTWKNVASVQDPNLLNTFQIVITTDGSRSFAIFNYDDTLSWGSSTDERYAGAGVFVAPSVESTCSYALPKSLTEEIADIAATFGNNGIFGRYILLISEPLPCSTKFQSACLETLPSSDWGSAEPYFSIIGDSWDVYAVHTCNIGFEIEPGINNERIDCVYEPDYYSSAWVTDPAKCLDLNKTKRFDIVVEVTKVGNDTVLWIDELNDNTTKDYNELKDLLEEAVTRILNLTDVIVTVTNITSENRRPELRSETETSIEVEVTLLIPPYLHKTVTEDNITTIITTAIERNDEVGGVTFKPITEVTDETDTCLQGCMCRFRKGPKKCPRGKNPMIKPDSCCGGCDGKPYSSTIKACCNNEHVYNPTKAKCCDGRVRKGATGKCP